MATVIIPSNVGPISNICSDDPTRFGATSGVRIETKEDGYTLIATDGRRLAVITGTNDKNHVGKLSNDSPIGEAVIPLEAFRSAFPPPPIKCLDTDEDGWPEEIYHPAVSVAVGQKETILAAKDDGILSKIIARNVEGRFPNWQEVMPKKEPVAKIRIDAARLIDLIALAESMQGNEGSTVLEIYENTPGHMLGLRVEIEGQKFFGILVGLEPHK